MHSIPTPFVDDRGSIQIISHEHNGSIAVIKSEAGAERANHYHKEDYHFCYVIYGQIYYYERNVGETHPPKRTVFTEGEIFYTGPMVEHCMYFPIATAFVTMGGKTRRQDDYENDLVRIASLHIEHQKEANDN